MKYVPAFCFALLFAVAQFAFLHTAFAESDAVEIAKQVDKSIADELFKSDTKVAPITPDDIFLRRVYLDTIGDIPSPEETTAFILDPAKDKRQAVVNKLISQPQYGQNWARYWRDVLMYRKLEERSRVVTNALTVHLTNEFNKNRSWDKIATKFLTSSGDVRENGATAIFIAQDGRTEAITSEVSRVFLGVQIQCAQCHDHPYDSWKREQFHELAAFFPRVAVRTLRTATKRTYEVVGVDRAGNRKPKGANASRRGQSEHYMPDMQDVSKRGTLMKPKFFLTGQTLELGSKDMDRRRTISKWITDSDWFAQAYVNRMWTELVGEGFYDSVDDLGPGRNVNAPKTLQLLTEEFILHNYDIKWLMETICATQAYQRECRPRYEENRVAFSSNIAQPLRADQLFNSIQTVLQVAKTSPNKKGRGKGKAGKYGRNGNARAVFEAAFGYDPSDDRENISASIPQVLTLMNSPQLSNQIRGVSKKTMLGKLLKERMGKDELVYELYLRFLSREPSEKELKQSLTFVKSVERRREAFEDLSWVLLNSAEFRFRR